MSTNLVGRRILVVSGATLGLLCAGAFWLQDSERPTPTAAASHPADPVRLARRGDESQDIEMRRSPVAASAAVLGDAPSPLDSEQETVAQYATEKYELLLEELGHLPPELFAKIHAALLRRELATGTSGGPAAIAVAVAKADGEVLALLGPAQRGTYDALKESDHELFQLNEYAGGVSNVAPLGADERKSILRTKLAYKGRFRQLVADSDLSRENLSVAEREHAYAVTVSALERYRQDYLQEVRQYLSNEEQFALLRNFETTEFAAELDKLRAKAGVLHPSTAPRGG